MKEGFKTLCQVLIVFLITSLFIFGMCYLQHYKGKKCEEIAKLDYGKDDYHCFYLPGGPGSCQCDVKYCRENSCEMTGETIYFKIGGK